MSYTGDDGTSSSTECSTSDACAPIPTAVNAASEVPDAPAAPEAGASAGGATADTDGRTGSGSTGRGAVGRSDRAGRGGGSARAVGRAQVGGRPRSSPKSCWSANGPSRASPPPTGRPGPERGGASDASETSASPGGVAASDSPGGSALSDSPGGEGFSGVAVAAGFSASPGGVGFSVRPGGVGFTAVDSAGRASPRVQAGLACLRRACRPGRAGWASRRSARLGRASRRVRAGRASRRVRAGWACRRGGAGGLVGEPGGAGLAASALGGRASRRVRAGGVFCGRLSVSPGGAGFTACPAGWCRSGRAGWPCRPAPAGTALTLDDRCAAGPLWPARGAGSATGAVPAPLRLSCGRAWSFDCGLRGSALPDGPAGHRSGHRRSSVWPAPAGGACGAAFDETEQTSTSLGWPFSSAEAADAAAK